MSDIIQKKGTVLFFLGEKRTIPFLLLLAACRPPGPVLLPPAEIRAVEGLAVLRIVRAEASARTKFGFTIALPDRGRIDVLDPVGRTVLRFVVDGEEAFLVLLSKRVYARGGKDEVLERFIGFPVGLDELAGLLAGRWEAGGAALPGWTLERDGRGRVAAGRRGDLSFAVQEFFRGGGVPRKVSFRGPGGAGSVTLLQAAFNRGLAPLPSGFWERLRAVSWEEVERLLRDED
ncbi:MAG: hypothetical protein FJY82_01275 [Candidatus Aminicenantes bacterium]|nr:hypothetical protein [Candidatus Aminicenantes bacterium]